LEDLLRLTLHCDKLQKLWHVENLNVNFTPFQSWFTSEKSEAVKESEKGIVKRD
jgi:hypothetical protein